MRSDEAFSYVKYAYDHGRLANGYLIVGPVRGAAMSLAIRILQLLYCTAERKPCGSCDACRHVLEHTLVDVHWNFPENKSRVISAEQMRSGLISQVMQSALGGGWKVGVLVGADRLNDSSANAFLKTLEEPPPKTLFLLLTDSPQTLLPTIISRCQKIELSLSEREESRWKEKFLDLLENPLFATPGERLASSNLLSDLLAELKSSAEKAVKQEEKDGVEQVIEDEKVINAKISARYREFREELLLLLENWFRDILLLKSGGDPALAVNQSRISVLQERARKLTLAQALYNVDAIAELTRKLDLNIQEDLLVAYTLDRLNHGI